MGNSQTKDSSGHLGQGLGLHDFVLRHVIGRGAFGKVRVVEHVETRRSYALKYISKSLCSERRGEANVIQERAILEEVSHAYIASLRFSFQTAQHVFLVLDLMQGGDLRFHMRRQKRLPEGVIRLWIAELASAINYLHTIRVVHRDIKPENVLMDHEGHVALTDFNAAIRITDEAPLHRGVAGTTSYMAPELISGGEYAGSVDWWSLGVLMYECVFGHRPFRRKSRDDLRRAIIEDDVPFPVTTDSRVSLDCISAIRGLLHKSPGRRLGCDGGFERLKAHPFFASIDWDALETRNITPIFVPDRGTDNFDKSRVIASSQGSTPAEDTVGSDKPESGGEGILDREYANFNYIEYLTFKAYVEQHGSVTADAVAEALSAIRVPDGSKAPPLLLQLRLDGRPIVRFPIAKVKLQDAGASTVSLAPSSSKSVRRRITTRAVARLKRINPSMVSLNQSFVSGHSPERQASDDTLPRQTDVALSPTGSTMELPPSNVPIDAAAWAAMLPSQRMLATRFCTKMVLDRITASLLSVSRAAQPAISSISSKASVAAAATKPRSSSCYIKTDGPHPRAVNAVGRQLRHWPSMTNTKDSITPRLVPIAAQWKAPRKGKVVEAQALVHKTNYPQLNSDPVIVAMAAEIAADGWEVIPKSAAVSVVAPWSILSPKQAGFGKVAIL
ncbi:hypothetical protein GGH94_003099 [Coemansia aciculifera]|uniref:Kinase-like protein n=1 Tax=Coemansia aciculifera TaxID=417176 RepID=A0A9W8M5D2_9FUNG|nr:hypothetical protein GGH94_003099 [Coemansia aciculifera]KAJ2871586.1 hypothetical protein GGH93_004699 [Coemansia aciculifera]